MKKYTHKILGAMIAVVIICITIMIFQIAEIISSVL
jgi:hypothetical protein